MTDGEPRARRRPAAAVRPMPSPRDVEPKAVEFLQLLADPTRRRIFLLLMRGEVCNCEVAAELGLAENLVSHHLRRLREAGLADEHRDTQDARWVHFTVNVHALQAAWRALGAAFDPGRLGSRAAGCCRISPQARGPGGRPGTGTWVTNARKGASPRGRSPQYPAL